MRERGTEERSSSSLLSLTLWEEAEVEMFVGKSINMVSAVHADDGRHGRRTGGSGGGCVLLYIYIYIKRPEAQIARPVSVVIIHRACIFLLLNFGV